jgi:phosphotransferase system enzyme I (PtsI)
VEYSGKGISNGIGMGQVHILSRQTITVPQDTVTDTDSEISRFDAVLCRAQAELSRLYASAVGCIGEKDAAIFDAQLTILLDEYSVIEPIRDILRDERVNMALAVDRHFDSLFCLFSSLSDPLLKERAADVSDLKNLMLRLCLGLALEQAAVFYEDVVLLAEELTPPAYDVLSVK